VGLKQNNCTETYASLLVTLAIDEESRELLIYQFSQKKNKKIIRKVLPNAVRAFVNHLSRLPIFACSLFKHRAIAKRIFAIAYIL